MGRLGFPKRGVDGAAGRRGSEHRRSLRNNPRVHRHAVRGRRGKPRIARDNHGGHATLVGVEVLRVPARMGQGCAPMHAHCSFIESTYNDTGRGGYVIEPLVDEVKVAEGCATQNYVQHVVAFGRTC